MVGQSEMQADETGAAQIRQRRYLAFEIAEKRHDARCIDAPVGDQIPDCAIDAGRDAVVIGADERAFMERLHYSHFIERVTLSPQFHRTICSIDTQCLPSK